MNIKHTSKWILLTLLMVCTLYPHSSLQAGEQLTLRELSTRSIAIASVHIDLKRNRLKVTSWLKGEEHQADLGAFEDLRGLCMPDRSLLKHFIKRYPQRKLSVKAWRDALMLNEYSMVIHLKRGRTRGLTPMCGVETLNAEHWVSHPRFTQWRESLGQILKDKDKDIRVDLAD